MKTLTRTIIVLVIINLTIGNFALAQNASSEGVESAEPVARSRAAVPVSSEPPQSRTAPPEPTPVKPTPPAPTAPRPTIILSGRIGLSGVEIQGLPGNPVTDENGFYTATVEHGWSGRVIPVREGYTFEPASMIYRKVVSDRTNQNYTMAPMTFTISGNSGVGGVLMRGLPGNPVTTDQKGFYSAVVKYGWRGTVMPKKEGFKFEPPELRYSGVMSALPNQNYRPSKVGPAPIFFRTGSRKVLVIPATDIEAEDLAAITEDLQVMSHIFDERFKEGQEIQGIFVDFGDIFGRGSRSTEAIYMQGYGVLFLMEVNFAFTTAPEAKEEQAGETEDVDPIWQRARRKMFSPPGFGKGTFVPEEQYSAEQIDQIKTELVRTLKHAANIRNLQPDEWIILTVIGKARQIPELPDYMRGGGMGRSSSGSSGRSRGGMSSGMIGGGMGGMGGGIGGGVMMGGGMDSRMGGMGGQAFGGGVMMGGGMGAMMGGMEYGDTGSASTTVLTIRAKKSDVDDFAIGELDFEQFQHTVDIFTY